MGTRVKICGITSSQDAVVAAQEGAHYIGVIVEIEESPRAVSVNTAQDIIAATPLPVVLLLEKEQESIAAIVQKLQPYAVQLVADIPVDSLRALKASIHSRLWKTVHVPQREGDETSCGMVLDKLEQYQAAGVDVVVLDTLITAGNTRKKGGTGTVCDWNLAQQVVARSGVPVFLAGGINPENVRDAICMVHPYGVDLSSGVEYEAGKKDPHKIACLMQAVKSTQDT